MLSTPQIASHILIKVYIGSFHQSCPVVPIIRYNVKQQLFLRPYGIVVGLWGGGEVEVQLKSFLTLVLNRVNGQLQTPATLPP